MFKINILIIAALVGLSIPAHAEFYYFTGPDGGVVGVDAGDEYLVDCKKGKYEVCYEGTMDFYSNSDGYYDYSNVTDSELYIGKKEVHYSATFGEQANGSDSVTIELDLKSKHGELEGELLIFEYDQSGNVIAEYEYELDGITGGVSPNPPSEVPVPAAAWMFGTALMSLGLLGRRKQIV